MKKKIYKIVWPILRIIIGIGLIIFLLIKLDALKILNHIRNMDIRYLFLAMISYFFFILISTWRWQVLLDYKKINISFGNSLIFYFIATFFNNFLPTTVGGDVMRIAYTMDGRKADALAVVLADRILGFIGLFIFGLLAVSYLYIFQHRTEFLLFMIVGLALLILFTFTLFSQKVYSLFAPLMAKIKILKVGERINNLHHTMTDFGSAWSVIIWCVCLSIIIQGLLSIGPFIVLQSMGNSSVSILPFFIYLPIINIVSMIPISFNALGVRENVYVLLFNRAGLSGEVSMTISLVSFFLIFLWSLLGGIFFIFYNKKKNQGGL
ncbi:MAG: lysylphosphatidylglycerol synthase transmembrane domain-containing protein [bacterium]